MSRYFLVANPDRKEFLAPAQFGDDVKLLALDKTLQGLTILLAASDGHRFPLDSDGPPHPIIGRWAGERIALISDDLDHEDLLHADLFAEAADLYYGILGQEAGWVDISEHVLAALSAVYRVGQPRGPLDQLQ